MKIGTLTFHKANNYGAVLQAYSLQKHLLDLGFETEIIDYRPNATLVHSQNQKQSLFSKIQRYLINPKKQLLGRYKSRRFEYFRKNHLKTSMETYYGDEQIWNNSPKCDAFIVGSDQVWNTSLSNNAKAFYLHFVKHGKKIAYAASFGKESFGPSETENIEKFLGTFDLISVREQQHQTLLSDTFNINSDVTLDPVFLTSKENWTALAKPFKLPTKYILVYVLEYSEDLFNHAKFMSKELECEIVYISLISREIKGNVIEGVGPLEFLYAFSNASYICTNSFHGTAFSIIFRKNFTVVKHSSRNSRIENLIGISGLRNRYYDVKSDKNTNINYREVNSRLENYIHMSKDFLANGLKL